MNHGRLILPAAILWLAVATIAFADTFTVINTDDTGTGSLRQAIVDANGHSGLDTIAFNIPGAGVHTITPVTQLPTITSPVTLDGYTQPGSSANTLANGDNAVLLIEINGATLGNNGNALVLVAGASGSTIRGLVIDNGWSAAILIQADMMAVEGCFLGTDPTGTIARGNTQGVNADGFPSLGLRIGGTSPAARNLISGNAAGIFTRSGVNHVVQGNFIGTNAAGTAALANTQALDVRSADTLIGGATATARNIIAGDGHTNGINVGGADPAARTLIQGNFIGTDVTGANPLGFSDGVFLNVNSSDTLVGGLTATPGTPPGNVISGGFTGITVQQGVSNSTIQGNLIGTDVTGTNALSNSLDGINVQGPSNIIGGTNVMARNVISANGRRGITLGAGNNLVQGNFIGTDITGTQLLGNVSDGVFVTGSTNNTIGGPVATAGSPPANVIAGNGGSGIDAISNVTGLRIEGNSILSNTGLGIDLNGDGVTPNDTGDPDTGPNNLQNYPVLRSVTNTAGNVNITGTLNSTANTTFRLEFFGNNAVDPSGFGEGQSFIGSTNVTTDANGNTAFDMNFPVVSSAAHVTATATDPTGNTSEFSAAIGQLLNISTRLRVLTGENALIGGFIITGTESKKVIIRAIGPSLAGVPEALGDPVLELHGPGTFGTVINDNWRDTQEAEILATGIAPTNNLESAIVETLAPDAYTAIVRGSGGTTGIGLVEAYDLDPAANSKLANISTRGFVDTNDNVMIGGFIAGNGLTKVVVRAIGPSLGSSGIQGALQDPTLELHNGNGATISSNDNWKTRPDGSSQQAEIEATTIPPSNDLESALVQTLPPGAYTVVVRGVNSTTGVALVEVYNLQ